MPGTSPINEVSSKPTGAGRNRDPTRVMLFRLFLAFGCPQSCDIILDPIKSIISS